MPISPVLLFLVVLINTWQSIVFHISFQKQAAWEEELCSVAAPAPVSMAFTVAIL